MPSQTKLIKQGIKYTDALFDEIIHRLEQGVLSSDTLEAFLEQTKDLTTSNPLVTSGYDNTLLSLILAETNNHKFSRPAQKELVRVTIENKVGELIRNVGDDIVENVRDIVKYGYNNNLSQDEIAKEISSKVTGIKNKRARAIARTEIARTATISDYVISSERGATHFYVECRNTACPICKEAWHEGWTVENDDSYKPSDTSAGGKGWIGNKTYKMSQTDKLPPIHPNCRCVAYFITDKDITDDMVEVGTTEPVTETVEEPTPKETKSDFKTMLKGEPKIKKEGVFTTYTYDNGLELVIRDRSKFSHQEIVDHINSLPEPLRNNNDLKKIVIDTETPLRGCSGDYDALFKTIRVGYADYDKSRYLDTLTHELAHALDNSRADTKLGYVLSKFEMYDKIFLADGKKFPTDYASRSWLKFKKSFKKKIQAWKKGSQDPRNKPESAQYLEDFAESSRLYLNPSTHDKFIKEFPNRAEYLERIYGNPQWDKNSPLYKQLVEEGAI